MDKQLLWRLSQAVILICIIIGMVFIYIEFGRIADKGNECIQDPFIYGAKLMEEKSMNSYNYNTKINEKTLSCVCSLTTPLKAWSYESS